MYSPLNYNNINIQAGYNMPSSVKSYNNKTFEFWERSLFQRAYSVLDFEVPEEWKGNVKDFLYFCLFHYGYVAVFDSAKYGLTFQPASLYGYDWYYQPVKAMIANPALPSSLNLKIGKECEILKLTPDYLPAWDIVAYYAEKLSALDNAINMSIINSKFAYMVGVKNKAAATAIKKAFDMINKGEPAVVLDTVLASDPLDKAEPWQFLERTNLKQSYITTDLLDNHRTLLNAFDAEIGLNPPSAEKKERLITSEVESAQEDATARAEVWLRTLQGSIDQIKELYPHIKLSVKMRDSVREEGAEDVIE